MDDAGLQGGCGKHGGKRLLHALESVGHGNQEVLTAAGFQVGEDLHPEFRAFGLLDPDAQDLAAAIAQHGQREIHGFDAHRRLVANLHAQGIEKHHGIERLERPALPRRHFRDDGVGDGADQIGRDLDGIRLLQEGLNLADCQPARTAR